jgi:NTE family protein
MSVTKATTSLGERIELLAGVPLFSRFVSEELVALAKLTTEVSYRKGEVLFAAGDEGGDLYVVVYGELEVLSGDDTSRVITRLGPGDHVGEIALLLEGHRTATVRVSRPARLLKIGSQQWGDLMQREPRVLAVIAQDLSRRLDARTRGELAKRTTLTVGVTGATDLRGKSLLSTSLATVLASQAGKRVLIVDQADHGEAVPAGRLAEDPGAALSRVLASGGLEVAMLTLAAAPSQAGWTVPGLMALMAHAHADFPIVVLDLGSFERVGPGLIGEMCDSVVELVAGAEDPGELDDDGSTRVLRVVNLRNPGSRPFPLNRCEPFVLHDDPALRRLDRLQAAQYIRDHPRSPAAGTVHRLARKLRGASVGVALAGGAAFGLAHVGVLQAFEEASVPVDLLAGTSMGSIVGALYASGRSAAELAEIVTQKATRRRALSAIDPGLSRPGLLTGNRLTSILRDLGLTGDFEDLVVPYQAMATDIESGEAVALGTGELVAACRASASIPGVFAPVRRDGRILVDGGVVAQVPAGLVRDMGADICFAVTVVPTLRKGVKTVFTRLSDGINTVNPLSYLSGSRGMPTLIDLVINSLQMLQYQLGAYEALAADAHVEVDTSDFTWVDFHRAPALIARGMETAEQALPELQRLLAERPVLAG